MAYKVVVVWDFGNLFPLCQTRAIRRPLQRRNPFSCSRGADGHLICVAEQPKKKNEKKRENREPAMGGAARGGCYGVHNKRCTGLSHIYGGVDDIS